jgi:hypothetical protein
LVSHYFLVPVRRAQTKYPFICCYPSLVKFGMARTLSRSISASFGASFDHVVDSLKSVSQFINAFLLEAPDKC